MTALLRMRTAQQTLERRRVILPREGNLFERLRQFLQECWAELKLAQRPTRKEVVSYSLAVLTVVVASALYLATLDVLLARLLAWFHR